MQAVSRTEIERVVKQELAALGFDVTEITPHSFSIGGMTTADAMGEDFDMLMQHGRWRSVEAARRYVSHSLDTLTSVSRALNRAVAQPALVPEEVVTSSAAIANNKKRRGM